MGWQRSPRQLVQWRCRIHGGCCSGVFRQLHRLKYEDLFTLRASDGRTNCIVWGRKTCSAVSTCNLHTPPFRFLADHAINEKPTLGISRMTLPDYPAGLFVICCALYCPPGSRLARCWSFFWGGPMRGEFVEQHTAGGLESRLSYIHSKIPMPVSGRGDLVLELPPEAVV